MCSNRLARHNTRKLLIGDVGIGGDSPIIVETMTKTPTIDVEATLAQIKSVADIGCKLVRVAVPDKDTLSVLPEVVAGSPIPVVFDIQFIPEYAISAIEAGASGVRLNPGNIRDIGAVREIAQLAKERCVHIRVGVNAGSLANEIKNRFGGITPEAMVYSAETHIGILEEENFSNIVVSLKAYDIHITLNANRLFSERYDYPLHIGITEAGYGSEGVVRSSVGLALILNSGIGNSIRVSLTGEPEDEIRIGYSILCSLGLMKRGIEFVSCPMCARCRVDYLSIVRDAYSMLRNIDKPLRVAIMGCEVNGPGEAREADIGLAFGKGKAVLFIKGEVVESMDEDIAISTLIERIKDMV